LEHRSEEGTAKGEGQNLKSEISNLKSPAAAGVALPSFRRYAGLFAALWRNSVVREMQFKVNFLLWIVVELLWFALQLTFMAVLYSHTDSIADWTKWQVVLLIGCAHFVQQLFTALFLTNITEISELIRTGKLDFMLLLPVNTRFLISFRKVDLGAFVNATTAVGVIVALVPEVVWVPLLLGAAACVLLVARARALAVAK